MKPYRSRRLSPPKKQQTSKASSRNGQYKSKRIVQNPDIPNQSVVDSYTPMHICSTIDNLDTPCIVTQPSTSTAQLTKRKRKGFPLFHMCDSCYIK